MQMELQDYHNSNPQIELGFHILEDGAELPGCCALCSCFLDYLMSAWPSGDTSPQSAAEDGGPAVLSAMERLPVQHGLLLQTPAQREKLPGCNSCL